MLDVLFGSKTAERVLLFLKNYGEGYPTAIANTYGISQSMVQKQLAKFEGGSIVVSRMVGKTRLYQLNPRWYFAKELAALLEKALDALPRESTEKYYRKRTRPRAAGKPLWAAK